MAAASTRLSRIRKAAAAWVVRLADPDCGDADRQAFAAWRAQSLDHDVAFEREAAAWERLDRLGAVRPGAAAPDPDLLASFAAEPGRARAWDWRRLAAAAAVVVVAPALALVAVDVWGDPAYATGVGERRLVVLPDHSRVELNTDTKVVVHMRGGARTVRVVRGEAVFDVAAGARPMLIEADGTRVATGNGQVDVRLAGPRTTVVVARGDASVSDRRGGGRVYRLAASSEAVFGAGGEAQHALSSDQLEQGLAWRQDAVDLNGRTLAEAVEEFNRYNRRKIVLADSSISNLVLGGVFNDRDVDGFTRAVTLTFPVQASADAQGDILLSARAGAPN